MRRKKREKSAKEDFMKIFQGALSLEMMILEHLNRVMVSSKS